jgi:hypothetical protein
LKSSVDGRGKRREEEGDCIEQMYLAFDSLSLIAPICSVRARQEERRMREIYDDRNKRNEETQARKERVTRDRGASTNSLPLDCSGGNFSHEMQCAAPFPLERNNHFLCSK